jgi:hypothetical protein
VRINPDTKDALLFATGLLGMIAQGVLWAFGVQPSLTLIGAYLTMCGIASASSLFAGLGGKDGGIQPDDDGDPDPPRPQRRRRKASADDA